VTRSAAAHASEVVRDLKAAGHWIAVAELTAESVSPAALQPRFPAVLVMGDERARVSRDVAACADQTVATTAAIMLHELVRRYGKRGEAPGNPPLR